MHDENIDLEVIIKRRIIFTFQSLTNVRDQMDQPAMPTPLMFSRPLSLESKAINNMDSRRNTDVKGDGARNSDNLSVPRRQTGRLPNVYAGAPESNL